MTKILGPCRMEAIKIEIETVKKSDTLLTAALMAVNTAGSKQERGFCCLISKDRLWCTPTCVIRGDPGFPPNECMKLLISAR